MATFRKDDYKTFICYRRKENNRALAPSEDVAGILYWLLNNTAALSEHAPVLFEECYPKDRDLTFDETGIRTFMPCVDTCFVVICPGFFQDILVTYQDVADDNRTCSDEELFQITQNTLAKENRIFYHELRYALKYNRRLCPIFVTDAHQSTYTHLRPRDIAKLTGILGEGSQILFSKVGTHVVDYSQLASAFQDVFWNTSDAVATQNLMQKLQKTQPVQELLQYLFAFSKATGAAPSADCCTERKKQRIIDDLKLCAKTVVMQQRPHKLSGFRAGNPDILYDPVRILHDTQNVRPPFLAPCLIESFEENRRRFHIESDAFRYWNVNLDPTDTDQERTIGLSVCAICFGTLSTYHRLWKDSELLEDGQADDRQPLLDTIQAGMNLLLALRNPYEKTWPSTWVFRDFLGVDGTTNQTTLSLSALMSCGFLSTKQLAKDPQALKARYEYIWDTVALLLEQSESSLTYNMKETRSWRYTDKPNGDPALLPTAFVFDTLFKLQQCIGELQAFFRDSDTAFCATLDAHAQEVHSTLEMILHYFQDEQCLKEGAVKGAFKRFDEEEFSVTHTAYVIKSLLSYVRKNPQNIQPVNEILAPATQYLVAAMEQKMHNNKLTFETFERYEDFCDSDQDDNDNYKSTYGDKYEHCAELIVAEALIKIAENTQDEALCKKIMELLDWLFDYFAVNPATSSIRRQKNTILIQGVRSYLRYPIYYLYYYRMFLWDYLALLKSKEA